MSITYEEALSTLEAMFGAPWTRETLDAVLRHEKGHMENTCERILNHGSKDPQVLIQRLKSTGVSMDEELARQLGQGGGASAGAAAAPAKKGRGTPTELPKEFLRIPGYKHRSIGGAPGAAGAAMDDETLARMLQDELFSEELARNPDFAHLARGSRRAGSAAATNNRPPGQRRSNQQAAPQVNPFEGVNVAVENLASKY